MRRAAQQDNILLVCEDHEIDFDSNYFEEGAKEKLIECVKGGTISDVLIKMMRQDDIHDTTTVFSWQHTSDVGEQHDDVYSIGVVQMETSSLIKRNLK